MRAGYVKHDSHIHSHIHVHTSPHQPDNDLQVREARSAMMGGVEDFDALWRNAVAPHRRRWRFRSSAMLFFFVFRIIVSTISTRQVKIQIWQAHAGAARRCEVIRLNWSRAPRSIRGTSNSSSVVLQGDQPTIRRRFRVGGSVSVILLK